MEFEDYTLRIIDIVKEIKIQLWGALLITNGIFISVLVYILNYYDFDNIFSWGKIVVLFCVLFLLSSSFLILINYFITLNQYQKIIDILRCSKLTTEEEKNAHIIEADNFNKKINLIERVAMLLLSLSFGGLLIVLISYVDLLNWINFMNIYEILNFELLNNIGLFFSFLGSISIATGLFITKKQALELGKAKYSGRTDEENLKLPAVKDRLKQRKYAIIGVMLLIIGLLLQLL